MSSRNSVIDWCTKHRAPEPEYKRGCFNNCGEWLRPEVLIDAPDGYLFDGELSQLVCYGWDDAKNRLSSVKLLESR